MAEGRPNSFLSSIPCGEDGSFLLYTTGKALAAQAMPHCIHLSPVHEREIEWQNYMNCSKSIPIRVGRGSLSHNYVLRRIGTIWGEFGIQVDWHFHPQVGGHSRRPRT